jgi:hypothetical protein
MMSAMKTRTLDVRPQLARGEEPFQEIMRVVNALGPDENLLLLTPFLPSPLIEKLRFAGFEARPERGRDGSWRTHFMHT